MARVNRDDLDWTELDRGETAFRRKRLGAAAGGDRLGCSLYELPPGRRSWPYHYHAANEEAIYVLSGAGTIRRDADGERHDRDADLRAGDYVALPTGEAGGHRVTSDADAEEPLRYLVISTMNHPDVTIYPDSNTFGVFVGSPPGGGGERSFEGYYDADATVDYWAGDGEGEEEEGDGDE